MTYFHSQKLKQIIALSGIVILGSFIVFSLTGFISAFLGSIILFIICSPLMNYLHVKKKMKKGWAAFIVILISFLVILLPVFEITNMLISKLTEILSNNSAVFFKAHDANTYLKEHLGFSILTPENIVKVQEKIADFIPNLLNETLMIVADIAIMYVILFYLLYSKHNFKNRIISYFPYKEENAELFAKELVAQTYSNVIGMPLLAIIQGIIAIIGFTIFGLPEPVFWGMMCGFLSFIPFVGTTSIWVPAVLVQLSIGESWQGIGLLMYGALVIANVDNVFRLLIQRKIADIHPLVTVFGVIIGLKWFGLPGLIFGPILISYFLIMLKVYRLEYGDKNILDNENDI